MRHRILIVEDDLTIAQAVSKHLDSWGNETCCVQDFRNVLNEFLAFSPSLVLLDIGLPAYNGYHWCSEIRKLSNVPIIYLSSVSDNMNIVLAINMGGDDFVAKPFDMNVLTAKVHAALRRAYDFNEASDCIEYKGVQLNLGDTAIIYKDEKLTLTKNEFKIMQILLENHGRIVSRDALMQKLWATDSFIDENTLSVNIGRLRKSLAAIGLDSFIITRKGLGYLVE